MLGWGLITLLATSPGQDQLETDQSVTIANAGAGEQTRIRFLVSIPADAVRHIQEVAIGLHAVADRPAPDATLSWVEQGSRSRAEESVRFDGEFANATLRVHPSRWDGCSADQDCALLLEAELHVRDNQPLNVDLRAVALVSLDGDSPAELFELELGLQVEHEAL